MDDVQVQGELLRGNIDTIILKCLFEGDKYGNEIMKDIEERTQGQFVIKQPTLYSSLTRLENQGLVTCTWVNSGNGGRRKYFAMTQAGKDYFEEKKREWEFSRTVVDKLISETIFDEKASIRVETIRTTEPTEPQNAPTEADFSLRVRAVDTAEEPATDVKELCDEAAAIAEPAAPETPEEFGEWIDRSVSYAASLEKEQPAETANFVLLDSPFAPSLEESEETEEEEESEEESEIPSETESAQAAHVFYYHDEIPASTLSPDEERLRSDARNVLYSEEPTVSVPSPSNEPAPEHTTEDYRAALSKLLAPSAAAPAFPESDGSAETNLPAPADESRERLPNGLTFRRHNRELAREYSERYYIYSNKLRLYQYSILSIVMLIETLIVWLGLGIGAHLYSDSWLYYVAIGLSLAFPVVAAGLYLTNPEKQQRVAEDQRNAMLYKFLITLECIVLVVCINILVNKNVLTDVTYLIRIVLPCVLSTNFMLYTLLYRLLTKSGRFAVR